MASLNDVRMTAMAFTAHGGLQYDKLLDTFNEDEMDAMIDEFEKTELAEARKQRREQRARGE